MYREAERGSSPVGVDGFTVYFFSPCPLEFLSSSNRFPGVIAALKVLFEPVYPYGSAPFVWCDREILEVLGLTPLFLPDEGKTFSGFYA